MLKPKKLAKEKGIRGGEQQPQNGRVEELLTQQSELLGQVVQKLQDHDAQFEELTKNQDAAGRSKLLATDIAYNPDEEHLSDMAVIVPRAVEPFALAKTLGAVLSDDVRAGKKSLTQVYISEVKHLSRGLKGKGFDLAAQHAREQEVTKVEEYGAYDSANLGKGL